MKFILLPLLISFWKLMGNVFVFTCEKEWTNRKFQGLITLKKKEISWSINWHVDVKKNESRHFWLNNVTLLCRDDVHRLRSSSSSQKLHQSSESKKMNEVRDEGENASFSTWSTVLSLKWFSQRGVDIFIYIYRSWKKRRQEYNYIYVCILHIWANSRPVYFYICLCVCVCR